MSLPLIALGLSPLLYGVADYVGALVPPLSPYRQEIARSSLLLVYLLNLAGIKTTVRAQAIMVTGFMIVLVAFGSFAHFSVAADNYMPFSPNGYGPVAAAMVASYFSFTGFSMIVSLGGENKSTRIDRTRAQKSSFRI